MYTKLVYPDGESIMFAAYCHDARVSPYQAAMFARDHAGPAAIGGGWAFIDVVDGDATYRYAADCDALSLQPLTSDGEPMFSPATIAEQGL